jgi:hypothetical protein
MALRNVYVAGGNGIGYTCEVDSSSDYSAIPNNTYFKDLSLGVGGMILYKDGTGQVIEIYASLVGKQDLLVSNVNIKTVNGIEILGSGNVSTYSNTGNILYVATTGSDTFPDTTRISRLGSINTPFLTLDAAKTAAISGDLIYVFAGNYTVTTTDANGLAKTGVNYYFEANANVSKSTAGPLFMNTASAIGTSVYGYGTFIGSGSCTYIYRYYSSTENLIFEAVKITHSSSSIFRIEIGSSVHFKVDYCTSTGGACIDMNTGGGATIVIDAIYWKSTSSSVIAALDWWRYVDLTVRAQVFESTTQDTIRGYLISCTLNLDINKILGLNYGLSSAAVTGSANTLNINCEYCTGVYNVYDTIFNGVCGNLNMPAVGTYPRFIGGSCNYITIAGGYLETNLGSYNGWPVTNPTITISGGTAKIKNIVAGYQYGFNSTGGKLYLQEVAGIPVNSAGSMRTINGGSVYITDFLGCVGFPNDGYTAGIYLVSGNLYLRGRLEMPSTRPLANCTQAQQSDNLIRTNAIVWLGGDLIADGCVIKTADINDKAIVCRGSAKNIQITSKGLTTNRPEDGGTFAAKTMKLIIQIANGYSISGFTLSCNGVSVDFSTTTAGKTKEMLVTEFIPLINASGLPIVASVNPSNLQTIALEATVAGPQIGWNIYATPYTGANGIDYVYVVRDGSYKITNILRGFINETNNII